MDHTSELESIAAHHQHVNSDEEEDMLLEELDLKTPKQISLAPLQYAAVYGSIAKSRTERQQAPRIMRAPHMLRNSLPETVCVLVVQERSGWFKGTGVWKLPSGTDEEAEDYEVLGFRQSHKSLSFWTGNIWQRSSNSSSKTGHLSSSSHTRDVSLKRRDHNKNKASMQKASSWITFVTFPGCLLLSNYRPYSSLCNEQRSVFSIWLPLLGMLNFTAFLSSLFLMVICGAHFTRLYLISALLLISAMLIIMNMLI